MVTTEGLLKQAAEDGTWNHDKWPDVLSDVLRRLDEIVRLEFELPVRIPEPPPPRLGSPMPDGGPSSQDSTTSNKENAPVKSTPPPRPVVPSFSSQAIVTAAVKEEEKDDFWPEDFPPDLAAIYRGIKKNLSKNFAIHPPHTVQRLAELLLEPKKLYRFLPSYIRALDRVVSVSSSTQIFPLPLALLPHMGNTVLNGASSAPSTSRPIPELGSDESLGGALLTPIPWLANRSSNASSQAEKELQTQSTEMVEGPNGAGRIETVNVINGVMTPVPSTSALRAKGAVTQGELLRQEQEAGVVPVIGSRAEDDMAVDETPHARGPEEIGDEDIGQQRRPVGAHLDLEAAVGRRQTSVDPEDASLSDAGGRDDEMKDVEEASDAAATAAAANEAVEEKVNAMEK